MLSLWDGCWPLCYSCELGFHLFPLCLNTFCGGIWLRPQLEMRIMGLRLPIPALVRKSASSLGVSAGAMWSWLGNADVSPGNSLYECTVENVFYF